MYKIGVIGDRESILGFKAVGLTVFPCDEAEEAKKILKEFKPDVVIGTGGYICVSVGLAAKKLKIPIILHESNAFPGVAVKLLSKDAKFFYVF